MVYFSYAVGNVGRTEQYVDCVTSLMYDTRATHALIYIKVEDQLFVASRAVNWQNHNNCSVVENVHAKSM